MSVEKRTQLKLDCIRLASTFSSSIEELIINSNRLYYEVVINEYGWKHTVNSRNN